MNKIWKVFTICVAVFLLIAVGIVAHYWPSKSTAVTTTAPATVAPPIAPAPTTPVAVVQPSVVAPCPCGHRAHQSRRSASVPAKTLVAQPTAAPATPPPPPQVAQVAPPPPASVERGPRKYTLDEIAAIQAMNASKSNPEPAPVAQFAQPAPVTSTPVANPQGNPNGLICEKSDKPGQKVKCHVPGKKDWAKQFAVPANKLEYEASRQSDSLHSLVKAAVANDIINGITAGSTLAGVVKNGNPTATAISSSQSSASASSVATAKGAGFGVVGQ